MSSSSVSLGRNLVSLKWEDFNMFVVSELAALYQKDDLTDVTLFCEGRSFRAHKVLLSLWSTYFRDVFRSTNHSHPVVILRETNSTDLELILRFIYQGHLLIPIEETDRFLKAAEHFQVAGLKNMRHHVPSFSYSGGSSTTFHEDTGTYNSGAKSHCGSSTPHSSHLRISTSDISTHPPQNVVHPMPPTSSSNAGANFTNVSVIPPQSPPAPHAVEVPASPSVHHHSMNSETSSPQQVIRQSSSRTTGKHVSPSHSSQSVIGFQAATIPPSSNSNSGTTGVTRLSSESVIFQPQPVLIFQNSAGAPLLKHGEQYMTTRDGRVEQPMMVIEGVVGSDSSIHMEPHSTSNHNNSHISTASSNDASYTIYTHPSSSPSPNHSNNNSGHNSTVEISSGEEAILGLPYNGTPTNLNPREVSVSHLETHHGHPHHHLHTENHSSTTTGMEVDPTGVPPPPYAPSISSSPSPSYEHHVPNNCSNSNSNSSHQSLSSKTNKSSMSHSSNSSDSGSALVYAVKRLPPPLPPSHTVSPAQGPSSRPFKNNTPPTNLPLSTPKGKISAVSSSPSSSVSAPGPAKLSNSMSTRSKSGSSKSSPSKFTSTSGSSTIGAKEGSSGMTTSNTRKVVLVPCPKCGKRVKQTSLKVHMKRTHLEEGTVLVCPLCSKRISSKGVYYKHMYLHRKRSEQAAMSKSATATTSSASVSNISLIKSETQGT